MVSHLPHMSGTLKGQDHQNREDDQERNIVFSS